jgi:phage protein D
MPVFSQAEADEIAVSRYNETAFSYITGEGRTVGRTDIQAGTVIRIEGVGERFSGLYYVTSARHSFTPQQGYLTSFSVRRNAT